MLIASWINRPGASHFGANRQCTNDCDLLVNWPPVVDLSKLERRRAEYGAELLKRLAADLSRRYGVASPNAILEQMRLFYMSWPITQTVSAQSRTTIVCLKPAKSADAVCRN